MKMQDKLFIRDLRKEKKKAVLDPADLSLYDDDSINRA